MVFGVSFRLSVSVSSVRYVCTSSQSVYHVCLLPHIFQRLLNVPSWISVVAEELVIPLSMPAR